MSERSNSDTQRNGRSRGAAHANRAGDCSGPSSPEQRKQGLAALICQLGHPDQDVRAKARHGLLEFGTVAVMQLVEALRDERQLVRQNAASVLQKLARRDATVAVSLVQWLGDSDAHVCRAVAAAIGYRATFGGFPCDQVTLAQLVKALDGDPDVRKHLVAALPTLAYGQPDLVAGMIAALREPGGGGRGSAAAIMASLAPSNSDAVAAFGNALSDPDPAIRVRAAQGLGKISSRVQSRPRAVAWLTAALRDPDPGVRHAAADALARIVRHFPQDDSGATAELLGALHDQQAIVREAAAAALISTDPESPPGPAAVAAFLKGLRDDRPEIRVQAAASLGQIYPTDPPATVNALLRAGRDRSVDVRAEAADALMRTVRRCPEALSPLLEAARHRDADVRWLVVTILGGIARYLGRILSFDQIAPQVVSALLDAVRDPYAKTRAKAARALGEIEPSDPAFPAVSAALRIALGDPDTDVRNAAIEALVADVTPPPASALDTIGKLRVHWPTAVPQRAAANGEKTHPFTIEVIQDIFPVRLVGKHLNTLNSLLALAKFLQSWSSREPLDKVFDGRFRRETGIDINAKRIRNYIAELEELSGTLAATTKVGMPKALVPEAREKLSSAIYTLEKAIRLYPAGDTTE